MIQNMQQFWQRSPAARLAAGYVVILMVISIAFSSVLYHFAAHELENGLSRQYRRLYNFGDPSGFAPPFDSTEIQDQLKASKSSLVLELIYFNSVILAVGSGLSYVLARRTMQPIEDALADQGRFTADASHELRTPLAAMQAEIEVARRNPKLSKQEAVALLDSNLEEVGKLRALADGLLQLARNEEAKTAATAVAAGEIVALAVTKLRPLATAKQITLDMHETDLEVMADAAALRDIVTILIDNAIKYSAEKEKVVVFAKRQGRKGLISVKDSGRGIAAADMDKIFDRFYRADKARSGSDVGGHGLGLAIAQKRAQLYGGAISAESEIDKGSTFTITLPLASKPAHS